MKRTIKQKKLFYTTTSFKSKNIRDLQTVEENVAYLLNNFPHLRNCDKCLIFYYFKHIDGLTKITRENIHKLTSAESITRIRRHLQRDCDVFLPIPSVHGARDDRQKDFIELNNVNRGAI